MDCPLDKELIELQDRLARERIDLEHRLAVERIELQHRLSQDRIKEAGGAVDEAARPAVEATPLRERLRDLGFIVHDACPEEDVLPYALGDLHLHADPDFACDACDKPESVLYEAVIDGEWTATDQPMAWNEIGLVCEECGVVAELNLHASAQGVFTELCVADASLLTILAAYGEEDDATAKARDKAADVKLARMEQLLMARVVAIRNQRMRMKDRAIEKKESADDPS